MFLSYERASRFSGRLERAGLEFEPTQSRFNGFGVLLCGDGNWNRWKFPEQGGTVKVRHFQEWTQTRTGQQREVAHWWPRAASVWAQSVGLHRAARLVRDTSLPDTPPSFFLYVGVVFDSRATAYLMIWTPSLSNWAKAQDLQAIHITSNHPLNLDN
jgi:hypothetical protein